MTSSAPHDYEFQLGPNRSLKGRGWRGLVALSVFVIGIVVVSTGTAGYVARWPAWTWAGQQLHLLPAPVFGRAVGSG